MGNWIEDLDDEQEEKLRIMWADLFSDERYDELKGTIWGMLGGDDPDRLLLRFLRARKWDNEAAIEMFNNCIEWRLTFGANEIKEEDLPLSISTSGIMYFHQACKENRPIAIIHVSLHQPGQCTQEELQKFCVYQMELGRSLLTPPIEKCTLIFDMTNFGLKNMDLPFVKFLVQCFQNYYPESLGLCLIYNAPWIFNGCWRLISPLIDPVVASKIVFAYGEDIFKYIDKDKIVKNFLGEDPYQYEYIPPFAPTQETTEQETKKKEELFEKQKEAHEEFDKNCRWLIENWEMDPDESKKKEINDIVEKRNAIKAELRQLHFELTANSSNLYKRLGVIRDNGKVINWELNAQS